MFSLLTWCLILIPVLLVIGPAIFSSKGSLSRHVATLCTGMLIVSLCARLYRILVLGDFDPKFASSKQAAVEIGIVDAVLTTTTSTLVFASAVWILARVSIIQLPRSVIVSLLFGVVSILILQMISPKHYLVWSYLLCLAYAICLAALSQGAQTRIR